ncbi:mechanosensitive ion channel family protein [Seohaeicola saemankumensis]|nr:mechanosensitive ion channel family protein [Seohaeicola saemankumensis]MCA0872856.1 mechanosensitive ion channel family protein [Seohaeicola saemankumensis]
MHLLSRVLLLFAVLFSLAAGPVAAQVPGMSPGGSASDDSAASAETDVPLTPEAIREMVARMSDDQVRGMLLDRLDAVAAAEAKQQEAPESLITRLQNTWTAFLTPTVQAFQKLPVLPSVQIKAISNFAATFEKGEILQMFGFILVALAAGFAAEFAVNKFSRRWQKPEVPDGEASLKDALNYLFARFWRELLGLVAFFIVLRTVGRALLTPQELAFAGPAVGLLIWAPRLAAAAARFVLAPHKPSLRMVNVNDKWAGYLYRNIIGLVLLSGLTVFIVSFNINNGITLGESRIGFWFDTAVHVYIALVAWTAREGLTQMMMGSDPDRTESDVRAARAYPYFAIGVVAASWVLVSILAGYGRIDILKSGPHYTTMFWLLMAPALDTLIRGMVRHLLPPMIGDGPVAERAYKATKRSYIRIGRVLVAGIILMVLADAWQIDLFSLRKGADDAGSDFFQFLITLAIGYILFEIVSLWINRRLAREFTSKVQTQDEAAGEGGGAGGSRLATVLPLLRVTAQVAIAVIFGLLALGNLGVDITPLLAGAGILGLAIGFGAQKLVSDIVGGIFFLIDDAFRVGEYVDVGGTMGTVEKISIRSMQLRHHRGAVHTIPYGEIQKLTNFSRDWVIMKLMFTVPFDTDPNKVKKIFKKIGAEMMEDPVHKDGFLEPFKSQGVFDFDDVGMVIRGKFMAKPGQQFTIRKEIYNRVKKEFGAAGIDFARREVRVAIPGLDEDHENISDQEKAAITAAAAAAVQQQLAADEEAGKK